MKKKTDKINLEICKAIVEAGSCRDADIGCLGKPGSMFEGHDCPLYEGDYNCGVEDAWDPLGAKAIARKKAIAQKFLDDHEAFDLQQELSSIEEQNPHEEILKEVPVYSSVQEAFEAGALKTSWFWHNDCSTIYEGILVDVTPIGVEYKCRLIDDIDGCRCLGAVAYFANYSEEKPELDPWPGVTPEQGFEMLQSGESIDGQIFDYTSDCWVKAKLDFVSSIFCTVKAGLEKRQL